MRGRQRRQRRLRRDRGRRSRARRTAAAAARAASGTSPVSSHGCPVSAAGHEDPAGGRVVGVGVLAGPADQQQPPAGVLAGRREGGAEAGVQVRLRHHVATPRPALLDRQPEPCLGGAAERADGRLLGQHRAGVRAAVPVGARAGLLGRGRAQRAVRRRGRRGGRGDQRWSGPSVPSPAPRSLRLHGRARQRAADRGDRRGGGRPEPSRLPVAAGSSTGTPLAAAARAGAAPTHARTRVSSPRRNRCARTPPVARPLAGYS